MTNITFRANNITLRNALLQGKNFLFGHPASIKHTVYLFSVAILIPSLAYYIIANRFGFLGPRVNLDLLLLSIIAIIIARLSSNFASAVVAFGIGGILAIQIGIGLGAVYIDDPALIREYVGFIQFWPWREISFWLAIAALALAIVYMVVRRIDVGKASFLPFMVFLFVLTCVDLGGRTAAGHAFLGDNVATSSAWRLTRLVHQWSTTPGFSVSPIEEPMMAQQLRSSDARRMMSISVESFGLAQDDRFNEAIILPMRTILEPHYTVDVGRHPSKGGTLSGEMRELCNARTTGTPTRQAARALRDDCLPAILASRGYETLGMHGNSSFFYNRKSVYPELGFQKTMFYKNFIAGSNPAPTCKTRAFDGICDKSVVSYAIDYLAHKDDNARYVHVMTLDTHFPLGNTRSADNNCDQVTGTDNPELCLYANTFGALLADIGRLLITTPAPDEVIIFGDHPPPYIVAEQRHFFSRDATPYIFIKKRDAGTANAPGL